MEIGVWALFLSLALNTISAALVPRAAEDNSLSIGNIRVADLLVAFAIAAAIFNGIPRGGFYVWGIVLAWIVWTTLAAFQLDAADYSAYRTLAEWQLPVYLVASWLVMNSLSDDRLRTWARRTVRAQIGLTTLASFWALLNGQAGADIATIVCIVAMLAFAIPQIKFSERAAVLLATIVLVIISGQRAAILLSLVPLLIAIAFWQVNLNRAKMSNLLTTFLIGLSLLVPLLLAAYLDPDVRSRFSGYIDQTFYRQAKQLSVESRLVSWRAGLSSLSESPLLGQGVGGTLVRYRDPGVDSSAVTNITHNTMLDFALRFGAPVGTLLVVALFVLVAGRMVDAWKRSYFSLWICAWALGGLLAKGMVESVFFKARLVPVIAVLIAVLLLQRSRSRASRAVQRTFDVEGQARQRALPTRSYLHPAPARSVTVDRYKFK